MSRSTLRLIAILKGETMPDFDKIIEYNKVEDIVEMLVNNPSSHYLVSARTLEFLTDSIIDLEDEADTLTRLLDMANQKIRELTKEINS
jgi:hypothetical protein